ncbi:hypothetical protein niasHT_007316 [Heterodera trifolii]|uniref:RanBD1 domain-containing protein n=1 Tax=Heterodera trifolii TaxID=157864 RepID=A0ABD2LLB7_9BILA
MDSFLQTNNDLIISIHKALVESTQEINRKIESLRDDVRDVKLSLAKNDRIMQEEATNWRRHTETIVKELGDRHQSDISGLHKLLMEVCIRSSPLPQAQPAVVETKQSKEDEGHKKKDVEVVKTAKKDVEVVQIAKKDAEVVQIAKTVEHVEFKPTVEPDAEVVKTPKTVEPVGFKPTIEPIPAVTTAFSVAPLSGTLTFTTPSIPLSGSLFGGASRTGTNTLSNLAAKVTAKTAEPVGFKPTFEPLLPAVTTAVSVAPFNGTSTFTTPSVPIGGSLFGGASRPGTNTFANLAAKAAESGGGFLGGGGVTAKPIQFGQSAFGTNAKDFKLFQQPPSQPSFSSNIHTVDKTADESYRGDEGSDKEDAAEEFVPDVHYEPVVPLPPEVEVSTGEEEEEVIFSARCKLYRFDKDARENKERGLGDIKLLYNPRSSRYRCVMRREQVFKLCANFPIYPDLKIHPREHMPTVYTWACRDFSDEPSQGDDVTFSARFKDKAIADEFYEKMTEAVEKSG